MRFDHLEPVTRQKLEDRYGLNEKKLWPVIATISLILGLPWLIWSGWHHSNPPFRSELVKYDVKSDHSVDITFQVSRGNPSTALSCTLVARDYQKNVVGEIDYVVAPSQSKTISITTAVPTRLAAASVEIIRCQAK